MANSKNPKAELEKASKKLEEDIAELKKHRKPCSERDEIALDGTAIQNRERQTLIVVNSGEMPIIIEENSMKITANQDKSKNSKDKNEGQEMDK